MISEILKKNKLLYVLSKAFLIKFSILFNGQETTLKEQLPNHQLILKNSITIENSLLILYLSKINKIQQLLEKSYKSSEECTMQMKINHIKNVFNYL